MSRIVGITFALLLLVVLCVAGVSAWIFRSVNAPHTHEKAADVIRVQKGSTPRQIIDQLAAEGIIQNSTAASIYLRLFGDGSKLQAGDYQFASPISTLDVFKELEKGQDLTIKLTIPEGFTRFDIAKRIAEKFGNVPPAAGETPAAPIDYDSVLALTSDPALIKDLAPNATSLEGYMYPTTYNLPRDTRPEQIIKMMVDQFRRIWKPEWSQRAKDLGRTPNEIVTTASLIETETAVPQERPIVAGVINNRLARNIPLGIDQTNVYIAKMQGRWDGVINKSDLEVDSPYNTRIKTGLPPGPISSVTESSIEAALEPTPSDFLYYVRNVDLNNGSHWFYASAADFEKGKAKYQVWLEQQREQKRTEETPANQ